MSTSYVATNAGFIWLDRYNGLLALRVWECRHTSYVRLYFLATMDHISPLLWQTHAGHDHRMDVPWCTACSGPVYAQVNIRTFGARNIRLSWDGDHRFLWPTSGRPGSYMSHSKATFKQTFIVIVSNIPLSQLLSNNSRKKKQSTRSVPVRELYFY
jgi:hypothetical protein